MIKRFIRLLLILTLLMMPLSVSCALAENASTNESPGFGIYLADTGELVISELDMVAYHTGPYFLNAGTDQSIELNRAGIERWNSFVPQHPGPKLAESLYRREFIVKIKDKEIYRGRFWSMFSSASVEGPVIIECMMKLDSTHNRIGIFGGYVTTLSPEKDPRNNPDIMDYLREKGLLKT